MNAPSPQLYKPKIFESDATDAQRQLYVGVCNDLEFDPEQPTAIDVRYQVQVGCRCGVVERTRAKALAGRLGVTRNTMVLTALKMGMSGLEEALKARDA